MTPQTGPMDDVLPRTEQWFVRRGMPQLMAGYGFAGVVSRMLPYLVFAALFPLLDLLSEAYSWRGGWWLAVPAAIGAAITWAVLTRLGRRRVPWLSTRAAIVVLVVQLAVVPAGMLALFLTGYSTFVDGDAVIEPGHADWAGVALTYFLSVFVTDVLYVGVGYLVASYGLVALMLRAARYALRDLADIVRLQGGAMPWVLFVTLFLFFTAELWQLMNRLSWTRDAILIAIFAAVSILAVVSRLREETGRIEQDMGPASVLAACRRTPLEPVAERLAEGAVAVPLRPRQEVNMLFALATRQLVRGAVVGVGLFAFFVLIGVVAIDPVIAKKWIDADVAPAALVPAVPVALFRLAALLAAFGSMYFVVTSMNDPLARDRFFAPVVADLERVLMVRAAYLSALGGQQQAGAGGK